MLSSWIQPKTILLLWCLSALVTLSGFLNLETSLAPFLIGAGLLFQTAAGALGVFWARRLLRTLAVMRSKQEPPTDLESLRHIISGITHDINNPLAIIAGYAEGLQQIANSPEIDKSRLETKASKLLVATHRAAALVKQLRRLSKDRTREPAEDLNLCSLLTEVTGYLKSQALRGSVRVQIEIDSALRVYASPTVLTYELLHLLTRALEETLELSEDQRQLTWLAVQGPQKIELQLKGHPQSKVFIACPLVPAQEEPGQVA